MVVGGYKCCEIKWTDPEALKIVDDKFAVVWAGTTLVRKIGSVPQSINDGTTVLISTVHNQYSSSGYMDTGLDDEITYYYSVFPFSTLGKYGLPVSGGETTVIADSILAKNSWDTIAAVSESGRASELWSIGDEINITLTGTYAQTLTLQIADFDHDNKADETGKAGITFVCKNLMKDKGNIGGYKGNRYTDLDIYNIILPNILSCFPSDLKASVKEVTKETIIYGSTITDTSVNKLFILSEAEVNLKEYNRVAEGNAYPIFTDNSSRIKKLSNGSGETDGWPLRTPYSSTNDTWFYIQIVIWNGTLNWGATNQQRGMYFAFCV